MALRLCIPKERMWAATVGVFVLYSALDSVLIVYFFIHLSLNEESIEGGAGVTRHHLC